MSTEIGKIEFLDRAPSEADVFLENTFESFSSRTIGEKRKHFCFLARESERIVAVCKGYSYTIELYISQIAVAETHRNTGLGRLMIGACENHARKTGCHTIWVDTYSYQAPDFYLKCDFQERHRIRNYRGDHDRIFFTKDVPGI